MCKISVAVTMDNNNSNNNVHMRVKCSAWTLSCCVHARDRSTQRESARACRRGATVGWCLMYMGHHVSQMHVGQPLGALYPTVRYFFECVQVHVKQKHPIQEPDWLLTPKVVLRV